MEQSASQHWTYKQNTTIFPWDESSIPKTTFILPFRKYKYIKVPFGLAQAPAYFQELMTGVLKDFYFTITYLDGIIIFSKTAEEHLNHIKQVFKPLWNAHLLMKLNIANATSSQKKSRTLDTSSAKQASDCYLQKPKPYTTCNHQRLLNRYMHSLDSLDTIGNLSRT